MGGLASRVLRGSAWVGVLRVVQKGMGAAREIILARLLFPEDFGLFGIASLLLLGFEVLTRTGFKDAIIHIRGEIKPYLHTTYWIKVLRGFLIAGIVYMGAPLVASFFGEPEVIPIVRVLAFVQVFRGLRSIGIVVLRREMNFRDESLYQMTGVFVNFVVTVGLGVLWRDVWALVWGRIAGEIVLMAASFWFHGYRPKFFFDTDKAIELFQFGIWLLGAGIVSYVALQADNIVAGRWISASALGVYQMGYLISNLPAKEFAKQVSKVVQSGYAEIQEDKERLKTVYQKTLLSVWTIVLPATVGMMITADVLVRGVLGEKWLDIIPILPILAFGALFRAIGSSIGSLFKATGHTSFVFRVETLRSGILLGGLGISVYLGAGLEGIAWAFAASTVGMLCFDLLLVSRTIGGIGILARNTLPGIGAVLVMALSVYGVALVCPEEWVHLRLAILVGTGVVTYPLMHFILERRMAYRPLEFLYRSLVEQI